mgnify:FL=1
MNVLENNNVRKSVAIAYKNHKKMKEMKREIKMLAHNKKINTTEFAKLRNEIVTKNITIINEDKLQEKFD